MREPTFDRHGYPTEATLDAIRAWDAWHDLPNLFAFIADAWRDNGRASNELDDHERAVIDAEPNETYLRLVTGGWSGNEDLLDALQANTTAYWRSWRMSAAGGLHIFRTSREADDA